MRKNQKTELWKYYLTTEHFLAIDIGTFGTKVMEVKRKFTELTIEKIFYLPEMNKFFKGKDIANMSGILENILHMIQVEEMKAKNIVLTFTSSKIQNKIVKFPDIAEKELKSFVEIEFQKQFPNASRLSDILDYMPAGKLKHNDQLSAMTIIATIPINDSNNIVQEVESKNLSLKAIDLDAHALGNAGAIFPTEHLDRALLNIGSETSNLIFLRDKTIVFSRPIAYGISNLAKAIQSDEDISLKEAERLIEEVGLIATEDVLVRGYKTISKDSYNNIIDENLGSALNETYRTFQFVNTNYGIDVEEVILTGGFSCLPNAKEITKSSLDLEVTNWTFGIDEVSTLPNGCTIRNKTGKLINGTFATCFGMAIRGSIH